MSQRSKKRKSRSNAVKYVDPDEIASQNHSSNTLNVKKKRANRSTIIDNSSNNNIDDSFRSSSSSAAGRTRRVGRSVDRSTTSSSQRSKANDSDDDHWPPADGSDASVSFRSVAVASARSSQIAPPRHAAAASQSSELSRFVTNAAQSVPRARLRSTLEAMADAQLSAGTTTASLVSSRDAASLSDSILPSRFVIPQLPNVVSLDNKLLSFQPSRSIVRAQLDMLLLRAIRAAERDDKSTLGKVILFYIIFHEKNNPLSPPSSLRIFLIVYI
jgi:hypothetical protein